MDAEAPYTPEVHSNGSQPDMLMNDTHSKDRSVRSVPGLQGCVAAQLLLSCQSWLSRVLRLLVQGPGQPRGGNHS